jgi:hypothetical protein
VHAWVEGLAAPVSQPPKDAVEFTYNPYRAGTFTRLQSGSRPNYHQFRLCSLASVLDGSQQLWINPRQACQCLCV